MKLIFILLMISVPVIFAIYFVVTIIINDIIQRKKDRFNFTRQKINSFKFKKRQNVYKNYKKIKVFNRKKSNKKMDFFEHIEF